MSREQSLWVEHDRYHTAIVFRSDDVRAIAPTLSSVLNDKTYVRFGWGDKSYYGASKKNTFKAAKALFLPTQSVIEVSNFATLEEIGEHVLPIDAEDIDKEKILSFINRTFKFDKNSQVTIVRVEDNGFHYYSARGIYTVFKNCNNWTAKSLNRGGVDIHYLFAFFSRSVMKQLELPPSSNSSGGNEPT